ncbi:MAG TPA: bifunctional oligoribonuclease/PAP phosphatase NrnA [Acholeplasmataceae bacterium]|jgi:phosphoesterase RecJ-like protein|nr:bifunctional oligoribonuclease/PAP phosphatase NrnA [Acholeplasmataceae bacterium]
MLQKIFDKIKEYNRIIIHRHIRPDGDCIGSQFGLKYIIQATYPEKEVYAVGHDVPEYLSYIGQGDQVSNDLYEGALVIVVDTATTGRIFDERYKNGDYLIKIDHHDDSEDYGDIIWVDVKAPATSAMIAKFYYTFKDQLVLSKEAARALFSGMVTDTGRFKYGNLTGDTFRYAGEMIDAEIDIDGLYANLYVKDAAVYKLQGYTYSNFKMTDNGVSYIYMTKKIMKKYGIAPDEAANLVNTLDSIKGSLIWVAFVDQPDNSIRVRLRSRFVPINDIGRKYNGGGHLRAAGATLYHKSEIKSILKDLDQRIKAFKDENKGVQ